jgi:DNA-binding MarR family transcriptional regulator
MAEHDFMQTIHNIVQSHRRYLELMDTLSRPPKVRGLTDARVKIIDAIAHSRNLTTVRRIAIDTALKQSHVSHALKSLAGNGLVAWQCDDADRRYRVYRLTDAGLAAREAIRRAEIGRAERMVLYWWPGKSSAVAALLGKLVAILERGY